MVDEKKALLYSSIKPDSTQEGKILKFLASKYGENVTLDWVEDKSVSDGFRLEIGKEVYDWTRAGRLEQFKDIHYIHSFQQMKTLYLPTKHL